MNMQEPTLSPSGKPLPLKKLHQLPGREVAEELSRMDGEQLRKITPQELDNGAWMKKDKKYELAPNVMLMVQSFNRLALLVTTEILEEKTPQARSKVIGTYIKMASKCHQLRNYNSLKAVLSGLQCTPIYRLSKSWKVVSSKKRKKFDQLSTVMSEEQNWSIYREETQLLLDTNTPLIPFLGVFLTTIALQQQAQGMMDCKLREKLRRNSTLCDDYVHLEAITVRNRLQRLRSISSRDEPQQSLGGGEAEISSSEGGRGGGGEGESSAVDDISENCESSGSDDTTLDEVDDSSSPSPLHCSLLAAYTPESSLPVSLTPCSVTCLPAVQIDTAGEEGDVTDNDKRRHSEPLLVTGPSPAASQKFELETETCRLDAVESPTLESFRELSEETTAMEATKSSLQKSDAKNSAASPSFRTRSKASLGNISSPDCSNLQEGIRNRQGGGELLTANSRRELFKKSKGSEMSRSLECLLDAGCKEDVGSFRKQSSISLEDITAAKESVAPTDHSSSTITAPKPEAVCETKKNHYSPMALLKQCRIPTPKKFQFFSKRTNPDLLPPLDLSSSHHFRLASLQVRREGQHIAHMCTVQGARSKDTMDQLERYQLLSLGCALKSTGQKVELRAITARLLITTASHNTEAQNYKLSYEREPL